MDGTIATSASNTAYKFALRKSFIIRMMRSALSLNSSEESRDVAIKRKRQENLLQLVRRGKRKVKYRSLEEDIK